MVILAVSHFLNASLGLTQWLLLVSGRSRLLLLDNFIGASLNIALGFVLIPRWGMVGTAVCVLVTIVSFQFLMVWQTWRAERVHPFDWRLARPVLAAAVMLATMLVLSLFFRAWVLLPLLFLSGVAVYLGMLWALGLPEEERQLVTKLRQRLHRR
jgi:O-antigen/teichoic acid export membrane protein